MTTFRLTEYLKEANVHACESHSLAVCLAGEARPMFAMNRSRYFGVPVMTIAIIHSFSRELLSRQETAQLLGVKTQTLAKWASVQRYGLPYIKVGKSVRYRRSDIDQYLARNTVGAVDGQ